MKFSWKFVVLVSVAGMAVFGLSAATARDQDPPRAVFEGAYQSFGRGRVPFDVVRAPGGQIVVVGRGGLLSVLSSDARKVVGVVDPGRNVNFLAVAMAPDGLLRMTDGDGRILGFTASLDKIFTELETGQGALFDLRYLADGTGVAVGEFGTVLVKQPGSDDWVLQKFEWSTLLPKLAARVGDVAPHLYRVCPQDQEAGGAFVVGEYGVVIDLSGGQWRVNQVREDAGNLFACLVTPSGVELVAGQSGQLFFRGSASSAWRMPDSAIDTDIYDLAYSNGALLAVGHGGVAQGSSDGRHWALWDTVLPNTEWIVRALPVNDGALLIGKQGYLLIDNRRRVVGIN